MYVYVYVYMFMLYNCFYILCQMSLARLRSLLCHLSVCQKEIVFTIWFVCVMSSVNRGHTYITKYLPDLIFTLVMTSS